MNERHRFAYRNNPNPFASDLYGFASLSSEIGPSEPGDVEFQELREEVSLESLNEKIDKLLGLLGNQDPTEDLLLAELFS